MMGDTMGTLTVKMLMLDGEERRLWWRTGDHGNDWQYEKLDIIQSPRYYKVRCLLRSASYYVSKM